MMTELSDDITRLERAPLDAVHDRRLWRHCGFPGITSRFPGNGIPVLDDSLDGLVREERHFPQSL